MTFRMKNIEDSKLHRKVTMKKGFIVTFHCKPLNYERHGKQLHEDFPECIINKRDGYPRILTPLGRNVPYFNGSIKRYPFYHNKEELNGLFISLYLHILYYDDWILDVRYKHRDAIKRNQNFKISLINDIQTGFENMIKGSNHKINYIKLFQLLNNFSKGINQITYKDFIFHWRF